MPQQLIMVVLIQPQVYNPQLKTDHLQLILRSPPLPLVMNPEQGTTRQDLLLELLRAQNIQKVIRYLQTAPLLPQCGVKVRGREEMTKNLDQVRHLLISRKQNQLIHTNEANLMGLLILALRLPHLQYHQNQHPVKPGREILSIKNNSL